MGNILDLSENSLKNVFKYLSFSDLYRIDNVISKINGNKKQIHNAIAHVVRNKGMIIAFSWESEVEALKQIGALKQFFRNYPVKGRDLHIAYHDNQYHKGAILKKICRNLYVRAGQQNTTFQEIKLESNFFKQLLDRFLKIKSLKLGLADFKTEFFMCVGDISEIKKFQRFNHLIRLNTVDDTLFKMSAYDFMTYMIMLLIIIRYEEPILHSRLKSLKLNFVTYGRILTEQTENLEELNVTKYKLSDGFLALLRNLPKLKKLIIQNGKKTLSTNSFFTELANWNRLKSLHLHSSSTYSPEDRNALGDNICKMTNLESLTLFIQFPYETHLVKIAWCLKKLRDFGCIYRGHFNRSCLVEFAFNAKSLVNLKLDIEYLNWVPLYQELVNIWVTQYRGKPLKLIIYGLDTKKNDSFPWTPHHSVMMNVVRSVNRV